MARKSKKRKQAPARRSELNGEAGPGRHQLVRLLHSLAQVVLLFALAVRPLVAESTQGADVNVLLDGVILLAFVGWTAKMALKGKIEVRFSLPAVLFLLFALVSFLWIRAASNRFEAILFALDMGCFALLFLMVYNMSGSGAFTRAALQVIVGVTSVLAACGLYQRFVGLREARELFQRSPDEIVRMLGLPAGAIEDFIGRMSKDWVFGTFPLPNSFAGFLVLVLPIVIVVGVAAVKTRDRLRLAAACLLGFAALSCLLFTNSKGGWIAFLLALMVASAWQWRHELWERRKLVGALCGAGLFLIVALHLAGLAPKPSEYVGSMAVRVGYWRGAARILRYHPWGIGAGGFGVHYAMVKSPSDGDTLHAHNDYVETLCELGPTGFLLFVGFWAAVLWTLLGLKDRDRQPIPEREMFRAVLGVGVAAAAAECFLIHSFVDPGEEWLWFPLFVVTYVAGAWVARHVPIDERAFAWAMLCGLGAFLFHILVDFDFHVRSVAQTVLCLAALTTRRADTSRGGGWRIAKALNGPSQAALALGAVALAWGVLGFWLPRLTRAEILIRRADELSQNGRLEGAAALLEEAQRVNSFDARIAAKRAGVYRGLWEGGVRSAHRVSTLDLAIEAARDAIARDPLRASYHEMLGELLLAKARTEHSDELMKEAAKELRLATRLFPSRPRYHLRLARVYRRMANEKDALIEYERALMTSKRNRYPREQLKPSEITEAKAFVAEHLKKPSKSDSNGASRGH